MNLVCSKTNIAGTKAVALLGIGQVAFLAGSWALLSSVELYSPNGDCQHQLAPLPTPLTYHILELYGNQIIACAGINLVCCMSICLL